MKIQPIPEILLHRDLRLESGPLTTPPAPAGLAVAVFAGYICSGNGVPAALRAMTALRRRTSRAAMNSGVVTITSAGPRTQKLMNALRQEAVAE